MWHEPISPHITTEAILAEEESIASWALAAQAAEPRPSTTVHVEHLDVLQADVAAAVAGDDRLVLVVGWRRVSTRRSSSGCRRSTTTMRCSTRWVLRSI
jgi:hypothetical protein